MKALRLRLRFLFFDVYNFFSQRGGCCIVYFEPLRRYLNQSSRFQSLLLRLLLCLPSFVDVVGCCFVYSSFQVIFGFTVPSSSSTLLPAICSASGSRRCLCVVYIWSICCLSQFLSSLAFEVFRFQFLFGFSSQLIVVLCYLLLCQGLVFGLESSLVRGMLDMHTDS